MKMYVVAANCESTEGLELLDKVLENQLDVFPDYVDCFLFRCQGGEMLDMVGDDHNI